MKWENFLILNEKPILCVDNVVYYNFFKWLQPEDVYATTKRFVISNKYMDMFLFSVFYIIQIYFNGELFCFIILHNKHITDIYHQLKKVMSKKRTTPSTWLLINEKAKWSFATSRDKKTSSKESDKKANNRSL